MLEPQEQIFSLIKKSRNILIAFKKNYNGDAVGSSLALYRFLRSQRKNVDIVCDNFTPKNKFNFLPDISKIKNQLEKNKKFIIQINTSQTKAESLQYEKEENHLDIIIEPRQGCFTQNDVTIIEPKLKYDLIFILDSPDLESLGKVFEDNADFFYNTPLINIDHSPENEHFGQINLLELTSSSTAEIIFFLIKKVSSAIDEKTAEALLTGIIDCTDSFKSLSVTPKTLTAVAELISKGADREKIIKNLYQIYSVNNLKLWGRALARLKEDMGKKLVWSLITKEDFLKTNTDENCLNGIIDDLIINMPEIKLAVLFYQDKDNNVNVIIKNKNKIDVLPFLSEYSPEKKNNGIITFTVFGKSLLETEKNVIKLLKKALVS